MPDPRLILASASPRRQELLREAGYEFIVDPADVDEDKIAAAELAPALIAEKLALAKARLVAERHPDAVVLGADTIVVFADEILGKPVDEQHARRMLQTLEGTTHLVITGVAAMNLGTGFSLTRHASSAVHMRRLKPVEIDRYLATGEWRGKAGGYGIQDPDPFVTNTAGSHTNIVGLPMELAGDMLTLAGVPRPRGA